VRQLFASTPVLRVADVRRSAEFYMKILGYEEPAFFGEPPEFCMLHRGEHDLMLATEGWSMHLRVADLAAERAAMEAAGMKVGEPRTTEYGMIELEVTDPDGHVICLGQDLERRPEDRDR
jgi:predicted lactoylglutathione lyase